MRIGARLVYVLLTGYILAYFSEWMFWTGRPPSETFWLEALPTWLIYSFMAFLFLTAVSYFRVRRLWAVFLAGALYGWLLEGVIVQTLYDWFPLQISWTPLAWHALISVVFGWYWLPLLMRRSRAIVGCLVFGLCLGLWSVGWWSEGDSAIAPVETVFWYNVVFGLPLPFIYSLWSKVNPADFNPTRLELVGAAFLLTVYFVIVTIPQQPLALVVLPPLLLMVLGALRRNRCHELTIHPAATVIALRGALVVLVIPLIASLVYAAAFTVGFTFPGLQVVYIITTPLGFIALGVSLVQAVKMPSDQS